jgi:hypothetical protein
LSELKQRPLHEIKQYLRKHNCLRVGSQAPPDIMRKMYESIVLAGDVDNSNGDALIHNFLATHETDTDTT